MQLDPNSNNVSFNLAVTKSSSQEIDSKIDFDKLSNGSQGEIEKIGKMAAIGNRIAIDTLLNLSLLGENDDIKNMAGNALIDAYTDSTTKKEVRTSISQFAFEASELLNFEELLPQVKLMAIGYAKDNDYHNVTDIIGAELQAPIVMESDESLLQDCRTISSGEMSAHIKNLSYTHIAVSDPVLNPDKEKIKQAIEDAKDYGKDIIVVPILENNNHWTALIVDTKNESRVYFNSNKSDSTVPAFLSNAESTCASLQNPPNASEGSPLTNGCGLFVLSIAEHIEQQLESASEYDIGESCRSYIQAFFSLDISEKESAIEMLRVKVANSAILAEHQLSDSVLDSSSPPEKIKLNQIFV